MDETPIERADPRPEPPTVVEAGPVSAAPPSAPTEPAALAPPAHPADLLLSSASFGGLLLILLGGLCSLGYLAALLGAGALEAELLGALVAVGSTALLLVVLGTALASGAMRAGRGLSGRRFGPLRPSSWLAALMAILLAGAALLQLGQPVVTLLAFPPLHLAAGLIPALSAVAYVARRSRKLDPLSWRGVLGRLAWGAVGATGLALLAETIMGLGLLVLVGLALGSTEGGQETIAALQALATRLGEQPAAGSSALDPAMLEPLLHPAIVLAVFLLMALLGPAVEELTKLAGVLLRPPRSETEAWAWGVAVGGGFGILESLFFSAFDLTAEVWPGAVLARAIATLMHATMTGLAALGWYRLSRRRQIARGLTGIGLSILGHGLWNGLALTIVLLGLRGEGGGEASLPGALAMSLLFGLILLAFLRVPLHLDREAPSAST